MVTAEVAAFLPTCVGSTRSVNSSKPMRAPGFSLPVWFSVPLLATAEHISRVYTRVSPTYRPSLLAMSTCCSRASIPAVTCLMDGETARAAASAARSTAARSFAGTSSVRRFTGWMSGTARSHSVTSRPVPRLSVTAAAAFSAARSRPGSVTSQV